MRPEGRPARRASAGCRPPARSTRHPPAVHALRHSLRPATEGSLAGCTARLHGPGGDAVEQVCVATVLPALPPPPPPRPGARPRRPCCARAGRAVPAQYWPNAKFARAVQPVRTVSSRRGKREGLRVRLRIICRPPTTSPTISGPAPLHSQHMDTATHLTHHLKLKRRQSFGNRTRLPGSSQHGTGRAGDGSAGSKSCMQCMHIVPVTNLHDPDTHRGGQRRLSAARTAATACRQSTDRRHAAAMTAAAASTNERPPHPALRRRCRFTV